MDGNHPKRRKDKYNPYTIGTTEDGRHWLTFSDGQGNRHHFEISAAVFTLFDSFELDDLSYLNEVDRHYEQIAEMEGCTKRAVKFSVDIAVEKLKKFFKNF